MAELPPRKNSTPTKFSKTSLSPLQTLLQMGFPRARALKALAATGYRNVQLASDWLLAHVNDPTLDECKSREYLLYLLPSGELHRRLQEFWTLSASETGRNGAHDFMPHVTLIPPFRVEDELAPRVVGILEDVVGSVPGHLSREVQLETYVSPNFMGYFIHEEQAAFFKKLTALFAKELNQIDVSVDCHHHQGLHLTLAYNFPATQYGALEALVRAVDTQTDGLASHWQFRLYSRDSRLGSKKVYKVIYPHVPRETDELELLLGDFVYADPEACNTSVDGWIEGISWLTGCSGFLPKNYVERTAESDAWTLHKTIELNPSQEEDAVPLDEVDRSPSKIQQEASHHRMQTPDQAQISPIWIKDEEVIAGLSPVERPLPFKSTFRRIFIVRHGERVDFTFGAWIPYCFDESGKYVRKDLNMPLEIPTRSGSPESFAKDCPLTVVGEMQATLLGQAMRMAGIDTIRHVFSSPSLRCLQTCRNLLNGLGESGLEMASEPGLFEWLAWYADSMPVFLTPEEIRRAGFNLKENHDGFVTFSELMDRRESGEQYYMRSHYVMQCVLKSTQHLGGDVLLVGHASTLDACSRQLIGGSPRTAQELSRLVHRIPYCSVAVLQEHQKTCEPKVEGVDEVDRCSITQQDRSWKLVEPPIPPMTHSSNLRFDWNTLTHS